MIPKYLHRDAIAGLPDSALRDCLFLTGKRGYGKSYSQRNAMERALTLGLRCGWIDAMGIGWGITVAADGRPGFPNVVIFGGEHAHLPISEGSASALGATLARATFSWVLDLTSLPGKASRVRFLADFCEALYETNRNQLLLFLDEVDLWAPQNIMDKQGPAPRLLGLIDEIVRRGRVKGLSAWMATQRPAVVNKNVISQADGVVTLKLTLPHDIDAVMLWMRKHLGKERAAEYELKIPGLKRGEALVYLTEPDVSVSLAQFPMIKTLDNMKAREPGDAELVGQRATVDLEEIRTQLGDIEAELKENDPAELRRRIQELERELEGAGPDPESDSALEHARQEGFVRGSELAAELEHNAWKRGYDEAYANQEEDRLKRIFALEGLKSSAFNVLEGLKELAAEPQFAKPIDGFKPMEKKDNRFYRKAPIATVTPRTAMDRPQTARALTSMATAAAKQLAPRTPSSGHGKAGKAILDNLAQWKAWGFPGVTIEQLALLTEYHPRTKGFTNALGALKTAGLVEKSGDTLALTAAGEKEAAAPTLGRSMIYVAIQKQADKSARDIMDTLKRAGGALSWDEIAAEVNLHPRTKGLTNSRGWLNTLTVIEKKGDKYRLSNWVLGVRP